MSADDRVQELAAKILDGSPIDWRAETSELDAESIEELRALAAIAELHRDLAAAPPDVTAPAGAPAAGGPVGTWGPLHLTERIGTGAFGEVFRAWDPRLDREVALKLLFRSDSLQDDHGITINEGRLLARIRHPNVVTVFGAERLEGRVGIWTEFVNGQTLSTVVQESGPLNAAAAIAIGVDLCGALGAIHEADLVHGDVKAQNVLQEAGGRNVLVDLGTGRERVQEVSGDAPREISGTPLYMAPELWQHADPTPLSDIYSLGVLLYYLVTATYPVRGATAADVREAHEHGRRTPLRGERADVPAAFAAIVERAVDPDPANRFQTAGAMSAALARIAPEAVRRRRVRATTGVVGGSAVLSLIALAWLGVIEWPWARPVAPIIEPLTFQPPEQPVTAAAIAPDGRQLAYVALDGLHIRNLAADETRFHALPVSTEILDLAWVPQSPDIVLTTATELWRMSTVDGTARRLAAVGGQLSVSPDGRRIALRDRTRPRILIIATDGTHHEDIVTPTAERIIAINRPSWSPNGDWIAYGWYRMEAGRRRHAIVATRTDRRETTIVVDDLSLFDLVWAPDDRILFATGQPPPSRFLNLWEIEIDPATARARGQPAPIVTGRELRFERMTITRNGSRLAFITRPIRARTVVAEFYHAALRLGNPRQVATISNYDQPIGWTPSGDAIVVRSSLGTSLRTNVSGPGFAYYRQPLDRPEPQRLLAQRAGVGDWMTFSPDGEHILYTPTVGQQPWRLMRAPAAGGEAGPVLDLTTWRTEVRCAPPPASRCVVAEQPDNVPRSHLASFDPRDGVIQRHGTISSHYSFWDISPDGLAIAYLDAETPGRLQVLNLITGEQQALDSPALRGAEFLAWIREARAWIVVKSVGPRGGEVLHIDGAGRSTTLWTSDHSRLSAPRVSPDGRQIAFTIGTFESNVAVLRR